MTQSQNNPQVPWTDEQWARATQVIQEEASRARVAAKFLPLHGPLPPDADFVRKDNVDYEPIDAAQQRLHGATELIRINDVETMRLATLKVNVYVRPAQMASPEMTSALAMFRRAANVIARLEDAIVFNGQKKEYQGPNYESGLPPIWDVYGGGESKGLVDGNVKEAILPPDPNPAHHIGSGEQLVTAVSNSISKLETSGHFGPFAVALGQDLFTAATTPSPSLVLPSDRIIPFLGGGSLVRASTLRPTQGVVVALGGAPIELVVATDISLGFLQMTEEPKYVFRVYEKIVLRIKELDAMVRLDPMPEERKKK